MILAIGGIGRRRLEAEGLQPGIEPKIFYRPKNIFIPI